MTELKVKGMIRSDGTLGLDPVCEAPGSDNGWKTYVAYPVPRAVVESYELAMGMRMQARALSTWSVSNQPHDIVRSLPQAVTTSYTENFWPL